MFIQITNKTKKNIHVCYIINDQNRKFRNIETKSLTKKATTEINFFVDSNLCHFSTIR